MATGGSDPASPDRERSILRTPADRYIYRNINFWNANLQTTEELVHTFETFNKTRDMFTPEQIGHIRGKLSQFRHSAAPCLEVNQLVTAYASQLNDRSACDFVRAVAVHQPEMELRILRGQTLEEISTGKLDGTTCVFPAMTERQSHYLKMKSPIEEYGEPRQSLEEYLAQLGICSSQPAEPESDGYFIVSRHGGEFPINGAKLTVPPGAVDHDIKCRVLSTGDRGDVKRLKCGAVYVSQVLIFEPHGEEFQLPVTVTVPIAVARRINIARDYGQVLLFGSNTSEDELPVFEDVTSDCSAAVDGQQRTVSFKLRHFSAYVFILGTALVTAVLSEYVATKYIHLAIGAKETDVEKLGVENITLQLCTVAVSGGDTPDPGLDQGYCLVNSRLINDAEHSQTIAVAFFETIDVQLAKSTQRPAMDYSCGDGGCWSLPDTAELSMRLRQKLRVRLSKTTMALGGNTVPRYVDGCRVLAEGAFACESDGLFLRSRKCSIHFRITKNCNTEPPPLVRDESVQPPFEEHFHHPIQAMDETA